MSMPGKGSTDLADLAGFRARFHDLRIGPPIARDLHD